MPPGGDAGGSTGTGDAVPVPAPRARTPLPVGTVVALGIAGLVVFGLIVMVRGGPAVDDAYGVTRPAADIAHGDLRAAAKASELPQPDGYALFTSPLVAAFPGEVGAPTWCDAGVGPVTQLLLPQCHVGNPEDHPWYRSQALLGVLAWLVLSVGALRLLRAMGVGGGAEVGLVALLVVLPAANDAIVRTFHPQDLVTVGLICAGTAEALRRRWVATGTLFGLALLCKQFALLPLIAVVAAAPGWRQRIRILVPAGLVAAAGIGPFLAADPGGTWSTLSAVDAGGAVKVTTGTLLGQSALTESTKLLVARDGPIAMAVVMALWARRRAGRDLLAPIPLLGLALACLAARLVAEVVFASYYLLAVSVALILLDLGARRFPLRSLAWIVGSSVLVELTGGIPTTLIEAVLAFIFAVAAVVVGLRAVPPRGRPGAPVTESGGRSTITHGSTAPAAP